MKTETILTDCDGVLLNWNKAFGYWMEKAGHKLIDDESYDISTRYGISKDAGVKAVLNFNHSSAVRDLPPQDDAITFVKALRQHGYRFSVISSLSAHPLARVRRIGNLTNVFGHDIFTEVICLPIGLSKEESLNPHRGSGRWWIEDKPENAELGERMGLRSILYNLPHNKNFKTNITRVNDWCDIYDLITNSS